MSWLLGLFGGSSIGVWIVAGVLGLGAAGVGVQTWRLHSQQTKTATAQEKLEEERAAWANERAAAAEAAASQSAAHRALEQTWAKQREGAINAAIEKTEAALVVVAAARRASDRLRDVTAARIAAGRRAANDPAAPEGCRAAAETADLLAVVQRRVAEAARGIGDFADAERTGHEACVGSYPASPAKVTP